MSTHKKARTVDAVASFQKNKTAALFYYTGKLFALVFSEGVFKGQPSRSLRLWLG